MHVADPARGDGKVVHSPTKGERGWGPPPRALAARPAAVPPESWRLGASGPAGRGAPVCRHVRAKVCDSVRLEALLGARRC